MTRARIARLHACFLLLAIVSTSCASRTVEIRTSAPIQLQPCAPDIPLPSARCGIVEVAENRRITNGRNIKLTVAVLPRRVAPGAPDPVFILVGGPGQSAIGSAASYARLLEPLNEHRDLVFVDQRGTGRSNGLACQLYDSTAASLLGDFLPLQKVITCRDQLASTADLTQYTTEAAAHDLDNVRRALGYDRINLEAASYGTRLALLYLRHYSASVRSAVLRSVSPPSMAQPLSFAVDAQAALDSLVVDCASDAICRTRFGSFSNQLTTVFRRLEGADSVHIKRGPFAEKLRLMLYAPEVAAYVPLLVEQLHNGEYSNFLEFASEITQTIGSQIFLGLYLSVSCTEDVARIPDNPSADAGRGFLGDYRLQQQRAACRVWPTEKLPSDFAMPVRSNVPVLLISSDVDPITPPRWAAEAMRGLAHSRHVVVGRAAHSPSTRCVMSMVWAFINAADTAAVDAGCVAQSRRPPFATEIPR